MTLLERGVVLSLLSALGCSAVGHDPGGECTYAGVAHQAAASFPATDGCNSCTCSPQGGVACTDIACPSDGGAGGEGGSTGGTAGGTGAVGGTGGGGVGGAAASAGRGGAGGANRCSLDASYTVGSVGGLVSWTDVSVVSVAGNLMFTRTWATDAGPTSRSCIGSVPPCGDPLGVDIGDLVADLEDPDVQAAFSMPSPALFGADTRPGDGAVYQIERSTGGTIQVGLDCAAVTGATCRPIPAGITRLAADLRKLIEVATTGGACENVTRPFPL
jgi:hypothetical protein